MCCFVWTVWASGKTTQTTGASFVEVVWSQRDDSAHEAIYYADKKQDGIWSEPVKITNDRFINMHPVIANGEGGRKWVVWTATNQSGSFIHYSIFADGTWSSSHDISSPLASNIAPYIAVDSSNVAWVVWSGNDGTSNDEIYFSRFRTGKWDNPVRLNPANNVPDVLPQITFVNNNTPVVIWHGFRDGAYHRLQSTWNGVSWSKPAVISNSSELTITRKQASEITLPEIIKHPERAFVQTVK
jgi:hypothetical protein